MLWYFLKCPRCKTLQKVHIAARAGFGESSGDRIPCIKCDNHFKVTIPDKILRGPFPGIAWRPPVLIEQAVLLSSRLLTNSAKICIFALDYLHGPFPWCESRLLERDSVISHRNCNRGRIPTMLRLAQRRPDVLPQIAQRRYD